MSATTGLAGAVMTVVMTAGTVGTIVSGTVVAVLVLSIAIRAVTMSRTFSPRGRGTGRCRRVSRPK